MTELRTYTHGPEEGDKPEQIVLLLHGLGSDGRDLIGLAPHFAQALPKAVFVSPDAPFPCDMAPMGYQWFSLQQRDYPSILKGITEAAPILDAFITQQLEKYELTADKLVLSGFSQGTMMSLYAGPRYKDQIAGILGYSGALFWEEDVDTGTLQKMPVELIHGEADSVVAIQAWHDAKARLEAAGFTVSGYTTPGLDHGIDPAGVAAGQAFLKRVLSTE